MIHTVSGTPSKQPLRYFWRVLAHAFIILLGVAYVFPIYWMLITSFKAPREVMAWPPTFWPQEFTLAAYKEVLEVFMFERWFFNSTFVAVVVTLMVLAVTSLGAFAFAFYRFPGEKALFLYILSTLMVPIHIRMIPSFLLVRGLGWVETYQGLIIPQVAAQCALGIFLLRQFYTGVPRDLVDAARIDGCREYQVFLNVGLPLVKPALFALGIFVFVATWNDFVWPLLMVQGEQMKTLTLGLLGMSDVTAEQIGLTWPQKMAGATLVVMPIVCVYVFFRNLFVQGVTLSGLKG